MIDRIVLLKKHLGLSTRAFAIKCGMNQPTLDRMLNGVNALNLNCIVSILSTLQNRIGRKKTVLISLAVTAVSLVIPAFGEGYTTMLLSFSLLGIGNAIMQTSLNPLVSNLISGDKLASTLTFGQFVKAIASFLAPILAAWGATTLFPTFGLGWRVLFIIYAVVSLLSVSLLAATPIDEERPDRASGVVECLRLLSVHPALLPRHHVPRGHRRRHQHHR